MSDERRAVLGETLLAEFQDLLKSHITGCLYEVPLSAADCKELHFLEAEMNQLAETAHELTALDVWLSSGLIAATPAGRQREEPLTDDHSKPSFHAFENARKDASASFRAGERANRLSRESRYVPGATRGSPEQTRPAFSGSASPPAAGFSGFLRPRAWAVHRPASRLREENPHFAETAVPSSEPEYSRSRIGIKARSALSKPERSPNSTQPSKTAGLDQDFGTSGNVSDKGRRKGFALPGDAPGRIFLGDANTFDPALARAGRITPRQSSATKPRGHVERFPDHFAESTSIGDAGVPPKAYATPGQHQTTSRFTVGHEDKEAALRPVDEKAWLRKERGGGSFPAGDGFAGGTGRRPHTPHRRIIKGLKDLAHFVESNQQGGQRLRPALTAPYQKQGSGGGFDEAQPNGYAPFPELDGSTGQHQSMFFGTETRNPGGPVREAPLRIRDSRSPRGPNRIRMNAPSPAQAPPDAAGKKETVTEGPCEQDGSPWPEKPDGLGEKDLDRILEALAREFRREFQRFYGD